MAHGQRSEAGIAGGRGVEYAGEISFKGRHNRGILNFWNNLSGHFQPPSEYAYQAGLPIEYFIPEL